VRAVWSFWSAPYTAHYRNVWARPVDHLLSWVVSVETARRHYPDTMLVTDTPGRRLLVDRLGLRFTTVSTELDRLNGRDPEWWMLGKLAAYSLQTHPFVHIDSDVFLWRKLPEHITAAPVLTQNPEGHTTAGYRADEVEAAMRDTGGILPAEWEWARSLGPPLLAENCGIVGGQDSAFLRHYAHTALEVIEHPGNQAGWDRLGAKQPFTYVVEQFLLSACIGYHARRPDSPYRGVRVAHLFPSWAEAFDANHAARAGFTHLLGGKSHQAAGQRLAARVQRDWPSFYRRCGQLADVMPA
jgi:hypothetical protein